MSHRLAIFASGNGSNAEAIFAYFKNHPTVFVDVLLTNNANAAVLDRAKNNHIESIVFTKAEFSERSDVLNMLLDRKITHLVLAGFLWLIPKKFVVAYPERIVNLHPSLLPKFGGKGMFGLHVHKAVKEASETETGITIHVVNEHYDKGKILFQTSIPILSADTPDQIAQKVHALEHRHYPRVIEEWVAAARDI